MGNFIGLVYSKLKEAGVDTSDMSTQEAIDEYNKRWVNEKRFGDSKPTDAEKERLKEYGIEEREKTNKVDADGNELSKQQFEYFRKSKIKDNNGNLMVCYHGTDKDFDEFDKNKIGANTNNKGLLGSGFYFTQSKELGDYYAKFNNNEAKTKEVYLNITKPFMWNKYKTEEDIEKLKQELGLSDEIYYNRYEKEIHMITDIAKEEKFAQALQRAGYDGIVYKYKNGTKEIVAFEPNQIKLVTNKNPTNNNKINT